MPLSREILDRNLGALHERQPEVAAQIQNCELPAGLVPRIGRDGTPTLMVPGDHGPVWMGGSSMPLASAEEMFGQMDPRGGSVTLPAMLTGMEAIVIAERIAPRFSVFVVDGPANFRIALSLREYSTHFKTGRIVLLFSDDIPSRTREFFKRNPGFALPAHLFKVPQVSAGQLANLTRTMEDAGAAAIDVQQECIAAISNRLRAMPARPVCNGPRVAILSNDDSLSTSQLARRLKRSLLSSGATIEDCLPTSSDQCHAVARLTAVERLGAEIVFFANGVTPYERSLFPPQLPIVDWISAGIGLRNPRPGGPSDLVVTENQTDSKRAVAAGWPAEQVVLLAPATDDAYGGIDIERPSVSERSPIAVLVDLPDDRPEVAGITLPSHITLWKSLQNEVLRRSDRYVESDSNEILQAAQQSSGTTLTDPALAVSFEACLRSTIAPATVARSLALVLVRNGFEPQIWGQHWPRLGRGLDLRKGPIPSEASQSGFWSTPSWVVIPWFSHSGIKLAIDAMANRSIVVVRGTRDCFVAEYPGLIDLADSIHWFRSGGELVTIVRRLISQHANAAEAARIVARRILTEHTLSSRISRVFELVRTAQRRHPSKGKS